MTTDRPAFVLVHGAWHNGTTWNELVPELGARGHSSVTIDLPGAGPRAANPASFAHRPLDAAAFASEASPNAGVTQDERTEATIQAVRDAAELGNGQVVLVGHSLGGLTISPVAEAIPDDVAAVVYLAAILLAPGSVAGDLIGSEVNAAALVPSLFMADPAEVGALRVDVSSADPDYVETARRAFYGDLTDEQFATAIGRLTHCDEPASVAAVPSSVTPASMGRVDRHYIHCADDMAILAAAQDHMVREFDAAMGSTTTVHRLPSSHSPFYSMPSRLAGVLADIAEGVAG